MRTVLAASAIALTAVLSGAAGALLAAGVNHTGLPLWAYCFSWLSLLSVFAFIIVRALRGEI
ncbi:MAG: hypothetical protein ACMVO3_22900 [Thalassobaculum sp.]